MNTSAFTFLFIDHFYLAGEAFLWFFAGAFLVIPFYKLNRRLCRRICSGVLHFISKLFGPHPGFIRTAATIFLFNGTAMFVYMSLGIHPLLPKLISMSTGFTLALCFSVPREPQAGFEFIENMAMSKGWVPSARLTILCGVLTAALELPSFWYSIAMGISLGEEMLKASSGYYNPSLLRAVVYSKIVLPVLFVSAICETIAIRGGNTHIKTQ